METELIEGCPVDYEDREHLDRLRSNIEKLSECRYFDSLRRIVIVDGINAFGRYIWRHKTIEIDTRCFDLQREHRTLYHEFTHHSHFEFFREMDLDIAEYSEKVWENKGYSEDAHSIDPTFCHRPGRPPLEAVAEIGRKILSGKDVSPIEHEMYEQLGGPDVSTRNTLILG